MIGAAGASGTATPPRPICSEAGNVAASERLGNRLWILVPGIVLTAHATLGWTIQSRVRR